MKLQLALLLVVFGGAACAQDLQTMDRTERPTLSGLSLADRATNPSNSWKFGAMPYFTYFTGRDVTFYGEGISFGIKPPHSGGIGNTVLTYRLDTVLETGFNHQFRDVFLADVQITPASWPVVITATYTEDNLRQASKYTGWGATISKSFVFGPGQVLELSATGTDESISFAGEGGGGDGGDNAMFHPFVGTASRSTVWDTSAGLFYEGGFSLIFDSVFKSDVEGASTWWTQAYAPLSSNVGLRFGVAQHNIFGFQVGYKF